MRAPIVACGLVAVLAAAVLPAAHAGGAPASEPAVVIRTYESGGVPPADHAAALAVATTIFEEAGVPIAWRACEHVTASTAADPCLTPLARHEIALRLVRLPASEGAKVVTLGYSLVETPTRHGSLATIYADRVAELAGTARVDLATLLGRTIAHELGHLLLGTGAHAPAGLMRATWSPRVLRRNRAGDWAFTPQDARALRDAAWRRR